MPKVSAVTAEGIGRQAIRQAQLRKQVEAWQQEQGRQGYYRTAGQCPLYAEYDSAYEQFNESVRLALEEESK